MNAHAPEQKRLERLLPAGAAVCAVSDTAQPEWLYPVEAAAVGGALERRQREFALGRTCARRALTQIDVAPGPIPVNERAPVWPEGVVGAIAHTPGLVLAAVARQKDLAGLGMDAEARERPLLDRIERFICTPAELARLREGHLAAQPDVVRLIFSAKEAVYKCIAPMSGVTLGFHDVEVDLDVARAAFAVRLVGTARPRLPDLQLLQGRFIVTPRFVLTSAIIWAATHPCGISATVSADTAGIG